MQSSWLWPKQRWLATKSTKSQPFFRVRRCNVCCGVSKQPKSRSYTLLLIFFFLFLELKYFVWWFLLLVTDFISSKESFFCHFGRTKNGITLLTDMLTARPCVCECTEWMWRCSTKNSNYVTLSISWQILNKTHGLMSIARRLALRLISLCPFFTWIPCFYSYFWWRILILNENSFRMLSSCKYHEFELT